MVAVWEYAGDKESWINFADARLVVLMNFLTYGWRWVLVPRLLDGHLDLVHALLSNELVEPEPYPDREAAQRAVLRYYERGVWR